jgi:ribonuclease Z
LLQQIAQLKQGEDVTNEKGELLFTNEELTMPPRHSRSYAYCSDTAYNPKIIPLLKNIDLLYHESTFLSEDILKAKETKHSTALEAATIAYQATVTRLLLGHFSARYKELSVLKDEARTIFANTELATEGETFTIEE